MPGERSGEFAGASGGTVPLDPHLPMNFRFDNRFVRELPGDPETARASPGARRAVVARRSRRRSPRRACSRIRREVAALLGLDADDIASPSVRRGVRRQRAAAGHGSPTPPATAATSSATGPASSATAARSPSARCVNAARRALGAAAQGRGPDAVLAQRRRPRGAALVDPRVPLQRGHAPPRRADHARAEPGRHRRAGACATCSTTATRAPEPGAVVCRVAPSFMRFGNFEMPRARDDLPLLERLVDFTIGATSRAAATRRAGAEQVADIETPTTRSNAGRAPATAARPLVPRGLRAHRADGRALDARRLRARRDEHRQHVDPRA